jgi:multimeric flavodoxin WrbA
MKIVVLTSSPHKKGTSNTLINEFVRGAEDSGKQLEIIDLAHIDIHPCLGCNACGMNGECIQKDKGNEILDKLIESDAIIFASPVYYYNVSAQLKIMIDRFYAKTYKITNKRLKAGVIMTAWNNDDWTYEAIDKYFDTLFEYMHFKDSGRIYGKGCGTVSMMPKNYYEEAYELGNSI